MQTIRGLSFPEPAAEAVKDLLARIDDLAGVSSRHEKYPRSIMYALHTHHGNKKNARGIFVMIKPTGDGAVVARPRTPKYGESRYDLLENSVDAVFDIVRIWFGEVQGIKPPTGYQRTEGHQVLAGGQFESQRSRH